MKNLKPNYIIALILVSFMINCQQTKSDQIVSVDKLELTTNKKVTIKFLEEVRNQLKFRILTRVLQEKGFLFEDKDGISISYRNDSAQITYYPSSDNPGNGILLANIREVRDKTSIQYECVSRAEFLNLLEEIQNEKIIRNKNVVEENGDKVKVFQTDRRVYQTAEKLNSENEYNYLIFITSTNNWVGF